MADIEYSPKIKINIPTNLQHFIRSVNFYTEGTGVDHLDFMVLSFRTGENRTYLRPNSIQNLQEVFRQVAIRMARVSRDRGV